jgi:hypothetical protein
MTRLDSRWVLAAGVLVSAATHLGVGVLVARCAGPLGAPIRLVSESPPTQSEPPPLPPHPQAPPPVAPEHTEPPPPKVKELKLGLSDAPDSASVAWLGYTEPTEQRAHEGIVEQSPMSLQPAPVAAAEAPAGVAEAPAAAPTPPSPAPSAASPGARADDATAQDGTPRTIAGVPEGDAPEHLESRTPVDLRPVGKALIEAGGRLAEAIGEALEHAPLAGATGAQQAASAAPAHPESAPPPAQRTPVTKGDAAPADAPGAARPAPAGTPGAGGGMPGLKADRESIAVSLKNAPLVVPGRVLAARGLEVLTRAPRFDRLTVATQRPRNPAVRVLFGKDGKVKRAEFVTVDGVEYNTGSSAVDRQLMNSIYAWTAKGRAVDELSADDPDAAVSIVFTILLR